MTLQDLLNADIETVGESLRQGLAWWVAELADLVPARWRRARGGDRPVAVFADDGETLRLWRGGRFSERRAGEQTRPRAADLGLPAGTALERELILPALGLSDLRRLVANDLDRLTPFSPDQVYFDLEPIDRQAPPGRRVVRLGVMVRAEAEAALAAARNCGVEPRRLGVLGPERRLSFDFLAALRAAGRGGRPDRAPAFWWGAVAVLIALNIAALVLRDMDDVAALRRTVDLQRPTVALAMTVRRRVEAEAGARQALLAQRAHNEPLRILDAVTRAFPAPQWIQRLEWNGRLVRLIGYRDPAFDVLGAVRGSTILARPRTLSSPEAAPSGAQQSFDVVAEPASEARR